MTDYEIIKGILERTFKELKQNSAFKNLQEDDFFVADEFDSTNEKIIDLCSICTESVISLSFDENGKLKIWD